MRTRTGPLAALAVVVVLAVGGCGGSDADGAGSGDQREAGDGASGGSGASGGGGSGHAGHAGRAVEIEVEVEDGSVTPSGERVDVSVGQPIRLVVESEVADEIHVHSTPEHLFEIRPGDDDRRFEFTLRQPGVVEAELHELGDVIVTLAVRP